MVDGPDKMTPKKKRNIISIKFFFCLNRDSSVDDVSLLLYHTGVLDQSRDLLEGQGLITGVTSHHTTRTRLELLTDSPKDLKGISVINKRSESTCGNRINQVRRYYFYGI